MKKSKQEKSTPRGKEAKKLKKPRSKRAEAKRPEFKPRTTKTLLQAKQ